MLYCPMKQKLIESAGRRHISVIYVTGDMHGDFSRFKDSPLKKLKAGDTLLVCGDFGFIWDGSRQEQKLLKKIGGNTGQCGQCGGFYHHPWASRILKGLLERGHLPKTGSTCIFRGHYQGLHLPQMVFRQMPHEQADSLEVLCHLWWGTLSERTGLVW